MVYGILFEFIYFCFISLSFLLIRCYYYCFFLYFFFYMNCVCLFRIISIQVIDIIQYASINLRWCWKLLNIIYMTISGIIQFNMVSQCTNSFRKYNNCEKYVLGISLSLFSSISTANKFYFFIKLYVFIQFYCIYSHWLYIRCRLLVYSYKYLLAFHFR